MKKYLIYLILALGFFCLGAVHKKSKVDRLVVAVYDYIEVLDDTVDRKSLSIADRTQLKRARRDLEVLYRDVKYGR